MSNRIHQAALTLVLTALTTAHAFALTLSPIISQQAPKTTTTTTTTSNSLTGRIGGAVVRPGNLVTQLTSSDCRLAGGTVVVPSDDRCGSTGAAYCRYPNTLAACLTER